MKKQYFGTDGIRGRVGEHPITPEFVLKLGWAAGKVLCDHKRGKIVIGKDTRISGYMFESALQAGLSAAGVDIRLLGPMPTPAVAYLTRTLHAQAGIVVSASHNPHYDNGIKFFSAEGKKLSDDVELAIEAQLNEPLTTVSSEHLGKAERVVDAAGRYIEFCKSTVPDLMEFREYKIVVDSAHGATYHIARKVFKELGATVIPIGNEPDGLNINVGCGSTQPELLCKTVREHQADFGIALDGDGDRVIMCDHMGQVVDGDDILYILACARQEQGALGGTTVVGTLMTNLGLELALKERNIDLVRARVGDRYVLDELQSNDWTIGGESSGHMLCLDRTTTGDGIVTALQVVAYMKKSGKTLQELTAPVQKLPQKLVNVKVAWSQGDEARPEIRAAIEEVEQKLGESGRVLLRPSGTEPVVRVMVEGPDPEQVSQHAQALADLISSVLSGSSSKAAAG